MVPGEIYGKRILFAVLNWGLGHATRSAVLIDQLLLQKNEVTLVSAGQSMEFLCHQFPQLPFCRMPTSDIVYPAHRQLWIKLLLQQKKIFGNITTEKNTVDALVKQEKPDLIISDNCYGFYSPEIPSILITHQVNIQSPFFQKTAQKKIHRLLQPFHAIWIPDFAGDKNLSGKLSRPLIPGPAFQYIGPLSSLQNSEPASVTEYEYCAIISGPEKQRTLFERSVFDFLQAQQKPAILIRGTNTPCTLQNVPAYIRIIDLCPRETLRQLIGQSHIMIGRTGYTTIMDLHALQKPCILLPTPGQTEQEYLYTKHFGHGPQRLHELAPQKISPCKG